MLNRSRIIKIIALVTALALGAGISYYYFLSPTLTQKIPASGIVDFSDARDTAEIIDIFAKDRYWLVSSPDYDPYHMLSTRSPNKREEKYFGKMKIKVLYKDNQFVGFTTYYMKNFVEGFILFVAVKDTCRGKRYGQELVEHALKDLKQMGALLVRLVTRVSNVKAQNLYLRVGFKETHRDEDFVHYAIEV